MGGYLTFLLHLCHVITHSFELHGGSKEVELVQTGNVSIESGLGAWLDMLVHQGIIDAGGTFAGNLLQYGIVDALQL